MLDKAFSPVSELESDYDGTDNDDDYYYYYPANLSLKCATVLISKKR